MIRRPIFTREASSGWVYVEAAWLRVVVFHYPRPASLRSHYFEWRWLRWPRWELQFPRLDVRWNIHGWRPWRRPQVIFAPTADAADLAVIVKASRDFAKAAMRHPDFTRLQ